MSKETKSSRTSSDSFISDLEAPPPHDPARLSSHHFGSVPDLAFPVAQRRSFRARPGFRYPDTPELVADQKERGHAHSEKGSSGDSALLSEAGHITSMLLPATKREKPRGSIYTEQDRATIAKLIRSETWRRRGYIGVTLALLVFWIIAFGKLRMGTWPLISLTSPPEVLVAQVGGIDAIAFSQSDCQEPDGTRLLFASTLTLLVLGLGVFALFVLK